MTEWRQDLDRFFKKAEQKQKQESGTEFGKFITDVVIPAFEELRPELEKHGRQVNIRDAVGSASLVVLHNGEEELTYWVQGRAMPGGVLPYADLRFRERKGLRFIRAESMIRSGTPSYALAEVTKEEVIRHFLDTYVRRIVAD